MTHLPVLPILIPLLAAAVLLVMHGATPAAQRTVAGISVGTLGVAALLLLARTGSGEIVVYRLGDWPAPYGIVLMADRLSAIMTALVAVLAVPVAMTAADGADRRGRHFHAVLQLQLAGLNGAFLTGDLFNLFVFFEILLLASYVLLMHGGGEARARAGLGFVVLNLAGSALFLIALGLVYATLGTLNMADLALVLPEVPAESQALVRTACALLASVFLLKAAVLPLGLWLPHVYTAALLPVAVLFVIMTKVGIYALLRVATIGFAAAPFTADLLQPWLPWLAVATIVFGALGALAAKRAAFIAASLIVISSGTMLLAVAAGEARAIAAMLYYLVHTTIVTAALLLLVDAVASRRGPIADRLERGPRLASFLPLGAAFLIVAIAASGAPPLSGFLGKVMLLQALQATPLASAAWIALLVAGLVVSLVLARSASAFFWEAGRGSEALAEAPLPDATAPRAHLPTALVLMTAATVAVAVFAAPVSRFASAAAEQLANRDAYVSAVVGKGTRNDRERRP